MKDWHCFSDLRANTRLRLSLGLLLVGASAWAQDPSSYPAPAPAPAQYPAQPQYSNQQPQYPAQQPQYPAQPQYSNQQPQYPAQQQYPAQPQYPSQQQYPGQQQQYPPSPYGAPSQYPGQASAPYPPAGAPLPPAMAPQQLDPLVARIALYPDPLLAQTLTAATYWNEISQAATWANQHNYLNGDALGQAIQADQLSYDPSILGLIPFPSVLDMMARDPGWTQQLGQAVLAQRGDVMDAVQRERAKAQQFGYLQPNQYDNVATSDGYIQIQPVNPGYYYVPVYNPLVVFGPPRPGFFVGGAISFGPRVFIGGPFLSLGWWGNPGFAWRSHGILIGGGVWGRSWANRGEFQHPAYAHGWARPAGPAIERHESERRGR